MFIPKKISEKEIYNNWKRKVLIKVFENSDGSTKELPVLSNAESIYGTMAIVIDTENNVYYSKEYRDWTETIVSNFAGWKLEEWLSYEENIRKELQEEMWVMETDVTLLWESIIGPYDTGYIKYFIAQNCAFGDNELEPWEHLEIQSCSLGDFEEKISSWEINCPLTVHCYTLAKLKWFI